MTTDTIQSRLVHYHVYDPSGPRLFRFEKTARASAHGIHCKLAQCPLLDAGQCVFRMVFGPPCPYGNLTQETGPTKRARKFHHWVSERRDKQRSVGTLNAPPNRLAFIGDYVFLPYAHMTMCKSVPFLEHSSFLSGNPFLPRESWTLAAVEALIDFRPQAMMGGEITSYQREQVPLFVQHIRELDPEMWRQLAASRPHLDTAPNFVGRKALLRTLNAPIDIPAKNAKYPVHWRWDGKRLLTTDTSAYDKTWGGIALESFELCGVPEDASVVVADNSWVNESTVFVD